MSLLGTWWASVVARGAANQAQAALGTPAATPLAQAPVASPGPLQAAAFVAGWEGFRSAPYKDVAGTWTYGYGSTRDGNGNAVTAATPAITEPEALTLLQRDLTRADHTVTADVHVPLTFAQRTALEDWIYNLGEGNFATSTLLRKLNAGDLAGAAAEFEKWDHAGGVEVAGLLRRRQAERDLFLK